MTNCPRLIEFAFPLKQASLDSVHEKNVRHGHISTLHIWPARRPLAACRAAIIATLLPDPSAEPKPPGMSDGQWGQEIKRRRQELCEKIGGTLTRKPEKKKMPNGEVVTLEKEVTEGGILHWGRESENKDLLEWFRQEIRKAYGGRAPKVLDPFAGGGAIPLEAMRLGCEVTAADINPVAWFILKCTLEYPHKLAGKTHPLPLFILENEEFMEAFFKVHPELVEKKRKVKKGETAKLFGKAESGTAARADLAWHVRAWGQWVLDHARPELAAYYPTYADFEPVEKRGAKAYEKRPLKHVPPKPDGMPDIGALNKGFSEEYLADKRNPRWVAKPTVAYLWARTVACKHCHASIPLLKTKWLCKKDKKRVLLSVEPDKKKTGVIFAIENNVPAKGGNTAQRREHDRRIGAGTMSRSGGKCPCCPATMAMEDIRLEGRAGRLGNIATAVVIDGLAGKEYRLPTDHENRMAREAEKAVPELFKEIPFGLPKEPLPSKEALGFRVPLYGFDQWHKLFTPRQLLAVGTFVKWTRVARTTLNDHRYTQEWVEAVSGCLILTADKIADYNSSICTWHNSGEKMGHTFARFALPVTWDFAELAVSNPVGGAFGAQLDWVARSVEHALCASGVESNPQVKCESARRSSTRDIDVIVTDPPYYDAIPYADLMDYFYIWLRRGLQNAGAHLEDAFCTPLSPKWSISDGDGELIDDASRHGGDAARSKEVYENGMARAFAASLNCLSPNGRLVIVFANKKPDAWEALVSSIIRAGCVVDGSWPIRTEMGTRTRARASAALSSSLWLVCKKRSAEARAGWDNQVLAEMRSNIHKRLRDFWDAGIRGPDFVWAATGPAIEAYSKHPIVKKANEPGVMTVGEFLSHVRRLVVDFVVGRVLSRGEEGGQTAVATEGLDAPTAYYLLHRRDFEFNDASAGACILYAISCGLSDRELADTWDLISFTKGKEKEDEDEEPDPDAETDDSVEDSGSKVRLKTWAQRKRQSLGLDAPTGKPIPLIDRIHKLMHLWKSGEVSKVDEYLDGNGLRRHELFRRVIQSILDLSLAGSDERALLESISNHLQARPLPKSELQVPMMVEKNL